MIYSILQLISALTLVNSPSSISTLSNYGQTVDTLPSVFSTSNIDDSLKVVSYYGDVHPLSDNFLDTEWKRGLNLFSGVVESNPNGSGNSTKGFKFSCVKSAYYTISVGTSVANFSCQLGGTTTDVGVSDTNVDYYTIYLTAGNSYYFYVHQGSSWDYAIQYIDSCMIVEGSQAYSYQPYHSDSELFDVQYDELAFSFDLEELDTGTNYQDYIDFYVSFSFASRVQYDGDEYTYSLRDFYFGFSRRDYDQPYPLYPILNYYIYSSYYFNIDSYTSLKTPLIYSSTDSYETLHYTIEGVTNFSSSDYITFSLCFEYIDPTLMSYMVGGVYDLDYREGFNNGKDIGYQNGVEDGKQIGYDSGYDEGKEDGKQIGIAEGREQVIETGQTASIIFNGIISVGLLPTNVFLQMLNLEVFGINIGALVSSLLTIMIIIIIGRMLFGGKNEV